MPTKRFEPFVRRNYAIDSIRNIVDGGTHYFAELCRLPSVRLLHRRAFDSSFKPLGCSSGGG